MKRCSTCQQDLPLSAFHRNHRDGHDHRCRTCKNSARRIQPSEDWRAKEADPMLYARRTRELYKTWNAVK